MAFKYLYKPDKSYKYPAINSELKIIASSFEIAVEGLETLFNDGYVYVEEEIVDKAGNKYYSLTIEDVGKPTEIIGYLYEKGVSNITNTPERFFLWEFK